MTVKAYKKTGQMFFGGVASIALVPALCAAQNCSTTQYPYPLQNGGVADAGQVMADLDCAPVHGLANYNGNVGVGTTAPVGKFQVAGRTWLDNGSGDYAMRAQGLTVSFSAPANYSNGTDPGDGLRNTSFISSGSAQRPVIISLRNIMSWPFWDIVMDPNDASDLKFSRAGSAPTLTLSAGNVGIGTTSPAATLHVNGSAILSQGYSMTSDARLKRDVKPLTEGLDIVLRLAPVRYTWKPVAERPVGKDLNLPLNVEQVGFLAQDLEKVVPEAVNVPATADQTYSINEDKLIPILVQAIKDQQVEIQKLNARIGQLERKK